MDTETSENSVVTQDQLTALRSVCERLAYFAGGSLPPILNSVDDITVALKVLTESCGKKIHRGRQDQEELREIRHELENVERLKARFIKNVSHELRTPLACIDGFARALLKMEEAHAHGEPPAKDPPPEEVRQQFLTIISQEAQRLSGMVEDVLNLSEIESDRRHRAPAVFTAAELIADTVNSYHAPGKAPPKITVRLKEGKDSPTIYADRNAMVEVLRELLNNAYKFSNGGEISLGAERVSIGPDRGSQATDSGLQQRVSTATQIYVKDKGIGIEPAEVPHIFEKFFRSEQVANKYPGTGLGLTIARALVTQDNGQIWCTSQPGAGTTFHVLLPDRAPGDPQ